LTDLRPPSRDSAIRQLTSDDVSFPAPSTQAPSGRPEWLSRRGRLRQSARLLDERLAALAGGAALRLSLIRAAFRRRDNIPEMVVLGLAQRRGRQWSDPLNRAGTNRERAPSADTGTCCQ
jgi:hypothetical protein